MSFALPRDYRCSGDYFKVRRTCQGASCVSRLLGFGDVKRSYQSVSYAEETYNLKDLFDSTDHGLFTL